MSAMSTAALSRYLAALDGPRGNHNTNNDPGQLQRRRSLSKQEQLNDLQSPVTSNNVNTDPNRPRSRSAGRAPRPARDLVQDVYDRVGVDYTSRQREYGMNNSRFSNPGRSTTREVETAAPFHQRYRAAALYSATSRNNNSISNNQNNNNTNPQSHETEEEATSPTSTRSQAVTRRWPPVITTTGAKTNNSNNAGIDQQQQVSSPTGIDSSKSDTSGNSTTQEKSSSPLSVTRPYRNGNRKPTVVPSWKKSFSAQPPTTLETNNRDEAADASRTENNNREEIDPLNESFESDELPAPGSVKERLSAYGGSKASTTTSRNFRRPMVSAGYTSKRDYPPKINIYGSTSENAVEDMPEDEPGLVQSSPRNQMPPSPVAEDAADAAAELTRLRTGNNSSGKPKFTQNRSQINNGTAGSFHSKIQNGQSPSTQMYTKKKKFSLPTDVVKTEGVTDNMSTISNDESFHPTQPTTTVQRDSKFGGRNRSSLSGRSDREYNTSGGQITAAKSVNPDDIDKLVEERVQKQVKDLETKMEVQMSKLETRLEKKMKSRLDYIEAKIDTRMDELQKLLSLMLKGVGSAPPSPGRQEV